MARTETSSSPAAAVPRPDEATWPIRNAWLWVPSLYFSQGIPYVIVMTMSVVMYKRLGISNTDIALYTSGLYLPWVLKPLWSPIVDITRTKRSWIIATQALVAVALAFAAVSVRGSSFFQWSLGLFWIMAFASATHDIAADGFYMLSMSKHEQAWWVGMRSTFYRAAMIVGSGLLVVTAGILESKNGLPPLELSVRANPQVVPMQTKPMFEPPAWSPSANRIPETQAAPKLAASPESLTIPSGGQSADRIQELINRAKAWNRDHGFLRQTLVAPPQTKPSWWRQHFTVPVSRNWIEPLGAAWSAWIASPVEKFLTRSFPKELPAHPTALAGGNVGGVGFLWLGLTQAPPQEKTIVVTVERKKSGLEYLGLAKGDKRFQLVTGERLVFDASNWQSPAIAAIQMDPTLKAGDQVVFQATSGNIPLAWSITLLVVSGLFLLFCFWHALMLPRPDTDGPVVASGRSLAREFASTLGSFFQKPGLGLAVAFILLYRFDEAQLVKVISPFLLDGPRAGGLGLSTSQVGLAYGTFGILALTCGGLLGGFTAAKYGLKTMLPFMIGAMYLPKLVFVFLSFTQPGNFLVICGSVALEQFGYGFGFTAFMLYLLYFADGPHRTAHYALCTGFMALGMMIPGLWSGWLADCIGYRQFFVWVIFSALPGFVLALNLKVDPAFGKK